jgi:hypothetical protein
MVGGPSLARRRIRAPPPLLSRAAPFEGAGELCCEIQKDGLCSFQCRNRKVAPLAQGENTEENEMLRSS